MSEERDNCRNDNRRRAAMDGASRSRAGGTLAGWSRNGMERDQPRS